MSQNKKMINQLGEIWKLEQSHLVSKASEPWGCSSWKVRGFPWLETFGWLAMLLWPCNKTEQTSLGDLPLTISYVCCLWLFTLTWQNQSNSPWALWFWNWLRKSPSAFSSQWIAISVLGFTFNSEDEIRSIYKASSTVLGNVRGVCSSVRPGGSPNSGNTAPSCFSFFF